MPAKTNLVDVGTPAIRGINFEWNGQHYRFLLQKKFGVEVLNQNGKIDYIPGIKLIRQVKRK